MFKFNLEVILREVKIETFQGASIPAFFSMLFHNRPVRAAMGSVIANGGVQLSNDESLIRAE